MLSECRLSRRGQRRVSLALRKGAQDGVLAARPAAILRQSVVYSTVVLRKFRGWASVGALRRRPGSRRVPGAGGLLAALLIVALLLCHGLFGFAHQVSACGLCGPAESPGLHYGPAADLGGGAGGHSGDGAAGGLGSTVYFAAMIALFGTGLLGPLFRAARGYEAAPTVIFRWPRSPALTRYPRGLSPPLLQAFRL